MNGSSRTALAAAVGVALSLAACGDDGNDGDLMARRPAERPAELRTAPTAPVTMPTAPSDIDAPLASAPNTIGVTVLTVEPTGIVVSVAALDNSFRPDTVEVAAGDEVLWQNRGLNDHDVLYVEGDSWGVEVEGFGPGAAYAHVFNEPGEYRYYCSIHGNETIGMTGTIIVAG